MKGRCEAMCSIEEQEERQKQHDISQFEATDATRTLRRHLRKMDPERAVKRYLRAADGRGETAGDVRPLKWLERTVAHLWSVALSVFESQGQEKAPKKEDLLRLVELYDFMSDRFMAVRKDIIVQGLAGSGAQAIYKRIIRFHILFDYLLTEQVPPVFDAHMGLNAVRSGLATLLDFFQNAHKHGRMADSENEVEPQMDEFLAYYTLLKLHDVLSSGERREAGPCEGDGWTKLFLHTYRVLEETELRSCENPKSKLRRRYFSLPRTQWALQYAKALAAGNWARFHRLCMKWDLVLREEDRTFHVLARCLILKLFPITRRRSMELWSKVMFQKEKMSVDEVQRLLCFGNAKQTFDFMRLFGLELSCNCTCTCSDIKEGGRKQDAWERPESSSTATATGCSQKKGINCHLYYKPRDALLHSPSIAQTYEDRQNIQATLCPRQDSWVLDAANMGEVDLWEGKIATEKLEELWKGIKKM